jgi:putative ABC transport system permease protein
MNIPLRAGRFLSDRDCSHCALSAVISEETARQYWPGEPFPVGQQIRLDGRGETGRWIAVAGVAGGIRASALQPIPGPVLYVSYAQFPQLSMDIAIRSAREPLALAPTVRSAIKAVDPEQPVTDVMTLERMKRNEAIGLTYAAVLMSVFGAVALVLSSVGVYGMTAYLVSRQTHEIGIRMALGATGWHVLAMVFRRGSRAALTGAAVGLLLAFALARLLASVIWGVSATDLGTFMTILLALILAVGIAICIPARKALKIDPMVALRNE